MTNEEILACKNGMQDACYGDCVNRKIRRRYSVSQELAILRQRDEKPQEFADYNAYVQACKAEAKAEIAAILAALNDGEHTDDTADSDNANLA